MNLYVDNLSELTDQEKIEIQASFNPGWISAGVACFMLVRQLAIDCREYDRTHGE